MIGKNISLIIFFLLLVPSTAIFTTGEGDGMGEGDGIDDINIRLLGCQERNKDGHPVIISGFFHEFTFNSSNADIKLNNGNISYHWFYQEGWKGDVDHIKKNGSFVKDGLVNLVAGIDIDDPTGIWNITIGGIESEVIVEKPKKGLSFSSADFKIYVEPFKVQTVKSGHQKLRLTNECNCPVRFRTILDDLEDVVELTTKTDGILLPGQSFESSISVKTDKWQPGIKRLDGILDISSYNAISNATFSLVPKWQFNFDINISVGHERYDVKQISEGITIEYPRTLKVKNGEKKLFKVYLSGDRDLSLDVSGEGIKIVSFEGVDGLPATLSLTQGKLFVFNITIEPDFEEETTEINYDVSDGVNNKHYSTEVVIEDSELDKEYEDIEKKEGKIENLALIFIGILIGVVYIASKKYRR